MTQLQASSFQLPASSFQLEARASGRGGRAACKSELEAGSWKLEAGDDVPLSIRGARVDDGPYAEREPAQAHARGRSRGWRLRPAEWPRRRRLGRRRPASRLRLRALARLGVTSVPLR